MAGLEEESEAFAEGCGEEGSAAGADAEQEAKLDGSRGFAPWADMLPEALSAIFSKLSFEELMNVVPLVCKSWRKAAMDPSCWQVVDMSSWSKQDWRRSDTSTTIDRMVRLVVDRSDGLLQELTVTNVGSDDCIRYIATRCSHLKKLFILNSPITDCCFFGDEVRFPVLQQLNISHCQVLSEVALENIGKKASGLIDLRRRMSSCDLSSFPENEALAIAQNMPKLRHLELKHGQFSKVGLTAILDCCKDLQYLDVRNCSKLLVDEELTGKAKRLKTFLTKHDHDIYDQYDLVDDDDDDPWESYDYRYDEIWLSDMEEWCMASQLDSDGEGFDEMFMAEDMDDEFRYLGSP